LVAVTLVFSHSPPMLTVGTFRTYGHALRWAKRLGVRVYSIELLDSGRWTLKVSR
jgi:hypothetical protein